MEVLYAARRPQRHGNVEEYFIADLYVFGRSWDTNPLQIRGYWFNNNPKTLQEIIEKLNLEKAVKKSVTLPDKKLDRVVSLAGQYPSSSLIHEQEYSILVDELFKEHSIMTGLMPMIKSPKPQ